MPSSGPDSNEKPPRPSGEQNENEPPLEPEDELSLRLADVEDRARSIRARNPTLEPPDWKLQPHPNAHQQQRTSQGYRGLGIGITAAYALVGPTLAGYAIGWSIDRHNGAGNIAQTWGTLVGLLAGFTASIFLIYRTPRNPG